MASTNSPPKVNVTVVENRNLPKTSIPWNKNQLPIDILFLTVKDCEFLSCLSFLNPGFYKSHHNNLGYVYFGSVGDSETTKLRIAVVKCNKGSTVPGGSVVVVKNATEVLRPKAVFNVGFCGCLNERKAKLGDVVVSARLLTYAPTKVTANGIQECGICVPLEKHLSNLVKNCGEGWEPPLEDQEALDVEIHRDGVLLSGPEMVAKKERRDQLSERFPEAIAIEMEGEGKSLLNFKVKVARNSFQRFPISKVSYNPINHYYHFLLLDTIVTTSHRRPPLLSGYFSKIGLTCLQVKLIEREARSSGL